MKKELLKAYLILVCLLTDVLLYAQPGDTDGTPTDNLEGTDPAATIDAMLLFIVVLAVVFGFYIVKKESTKSKGIY
jgi:hypothetical protein